MPNPALSTLTDDALRRLQEAHPPIISDASDPANEYPNAILAEGKRRGLWK